jgi:hypothetical protein
MQDVALRSTGYRIRQVQAKPEKELVHVVIAKDDLDAGLVFPA